ncbi:MAG: hypothetical protein RLZZ574_400 [Cyanobacteriota bacterium]|jgi:phage protein D
MPNDASLLNPTVQILIQDKALKPEVATDLVSVSISDDLEAPSMFELRLVTWDLLKQKMTWVDDQSLFNLGNEVEIKIGYETKLETLIFGEITGLEPEYLQNVTPILVVRGYDLGHRLLRGRHTKSFLKMKDSDIVSQIAIARGLTPKVTDSKLQLEYILQHNQTDWEFLQERALRIGYEVFMDEKTLFFRPPENIKSKTLTLTYGEDLQEFLPRLSTLNQVETLEVRGWNLLEKKEIISKAQVGNEGGTMGGKTSGSKAVKKAFGESIDTVVNQPVWNKSEADNMAAGQFKHKSLAYISGEGTCLGNASLRAGKVIEIAGVGERFSGLYYLMSVEHTYTIRQGYKTSFTVRRNAT